MPIFHCDTTYNGMQFQIPAKVAPCLLNSYSVRHTIMNGSIHGVLGGIHKIMNGETHSIQKDLISKLKCRPIQPINFLTNTILADLAQMLEEEWNAIPLQRATRLVNSMRRRCQEVIDKRGGYTHY